MFSLIKLTGMSVTAFCCIMWGFFKSNRLYLRQKALEDAAEMVKNMQIELSYNAPDTNELIYRMSLKKEFKRLGFLKQCADECKIKPFPIAWKDALLSESSSCFEEEDISILKVLGEHLGSTDIEGQIAGLKAVEDRVNLKLEKVRQKNIKEAPLYKTLGVLAGMGAIIITM